MLLPMRRQSITLDRKRLRNLHVIQDGEPDGISDDALLAANPRPQTRGDCLAGGVNEERPCPWVSCKYHLALDVVDGGSIKFTKRDQDVADMQTSCTLDVADDGAHTLDEVGQALALTRERARQIEFMAVQKIKPRAVRWDER